MEKKGAFDYILLETTGLADPGNLAPLFWVDEGLGSTIYLDGIVTLVDAKNILESLNEPVKETIQHDEHETHGGPLMTTAHSQISHADVIVINKSDLVSEEELLAVQNRVGAINGLAKVHVTVQGQVPRLEGFLLDLDAYKNVGALDVSSKGHSHLDPVCSLTHKFARMVLINLQAISTVAFGVPILDASQLSLLDAWLRSLLWDSQLINQALGNDANLADSENLAIHRIKARVFMSDGTVKIVQGVREVFEIFAAPTQLDSIPENASKPQGKMVLIGKNLSNYDFEASLLNTIRSR